MCGICGVAGHITNTEVKAFSDLLVLSGLRGLSATGTFNLRTDHDRKDSIRFYKKLGSPISFLHSPTTKILLEPENDEGKLKVLVGHTRSPTQGVVTKENAHPFDHTNVIGVHNGNITGGLKDREKFDVDSDCLYNNISERGIKSTLEDLHYDAAYTLVYIDKVEHTLNFIRNYKRPLHFLETNNGNTLYWASESLMLTTVAKKWNLGSSSAYELSTDNLITIDYHDDKFPKIRKSTRIEKSNYVWDDGDYYYLVPKSRTVHYLEKPKEEPSKWVPIGGTIEPVHRINNVLVSDHYFWKLLQKGCAWCSSVPQNVKEAKAVHWTGDSEFICDDCSVIPEVKQYIIQ